MCCLPFFRHRKRAFFARINPSCERRAQNNQPSSELVRLFVGHVQTPASSCLLALQVVEMVFQRGLVKVLFATETFAMGMYA